MGSQAINHDIMQAFSELSSKVWLQNALSAAVDANVFEALTDAPITAHDIATKLNMDSATLYRLLRGLAANGYTYESAEHAFSHNDASRTLRKDAPNSLRASVQLISLPLMQAAWQHLGDTLRDGRSAFSHAFGKEIYTHLAKDKASAEVFNASMTAYSQAHMHEVVEHYTDFGRCKNILDVAGGVGHLLVGILQHYPALRGGVLDLKQLQAPCEAFLKTSNLGARASYVEGNMFEMLPAGYDTYMIKNALWNWADDNCLRVLRSMRRALGKEKGRVLIIEQLVTPQNAAHSTLFDLQMLVVTAGGRSRTEAEFIALGQEAGLEHKRTLPLGSTHVLEFLPV